MAVWAGASRTLVAHTNIAEKHMRPSFLATLVTGAVFLACSDGGGSTGPDTSAVTHVSVSAASLLNSFGATTRLTATALNSANQSVTGSAFTWSSSAASVATVDPTGLVTAVANGSATISATTGAIKGTVVVTVAQSVATVQMNPATVPSLTSVGATTVLAAAGQDGHSNAVSDAAYTWTSSDATVATVSNGTVTAVANGTATITATAPGGASATALVTVAQAISSVVVTPGTLATFDALGATAPLAAEARDANGHAVPGAAITWASSSTGVATVNAGTVTSTGNGTTRVTAASAGKLDTVNVTVTQVANNVTSNCPTGALNSWGATKQCTASVRDRLNVNMAGTIVWSSNAVGVVTVSAGGLVSARNNGTGSIVATFGALSASVPVTVAFKIAYGTMVQGTTDAVSVNQAYDITGGGATTQLVTWISRSPIASSGIDPHLFFDNSTFARGGITTGRLTAGSELLARANYPNSLPSTLNMYGEAGSLGGYVMGLADCREPMGAFPTTGYYSWAALEATDCAVLNGPASGTTLNLTSAVVLRIDQLNAGDNVSIEVVAGCNPGALSHGCSGSGGTMDPYVYVFGPNDQQVWFDDDGAGLTNSRVTINPVPTTGTYTVLITTFVAGQAGTFTVCAFANCASNAGAPRAFAGPPAAATAEWSSHLTVERAYARLREMGLLPKDFDWRRPRTDRKARR
ncbi:MAG TPA: Ig-like domain-containing protein [Gemmatimonadales bacterium]